MANIDITDAGASLSNGLLQLENGVAMDTTLRYVSDQLNTKSQLLLATNATTVEGTLKIKTSNVEYLDVEDALGNNRFTISKAVGSQKVDLDFASNPTGSTTIVGAIRTYTDGANLNDIVQFREDGQTTFVERVNIEADSLVTTQTSSVIASTTTNANLVIAPNGTGALIADIPDGTATGGNARGTNAVDLQTNRLVATSVASGTNSTISGGRNNSASGADSTISGGVGNTASSNHSTISGGQSNTASTNTHATVVGGQSNTSSGAHSISGGFSNNSTALRSVALGDQNTASGSSSFATNSSIASNAYASCFGQSGNANTSYSFVIGKYGLGNLFNAFVHSNSDFGSSSFSQYSNLIANRNATLTTGATTVLSLDGTGTTNLIIPNGNNRVWNVVASWTAVVTAIIGTATGVSVGDVATECNLFAFKRIGGTSSVVGTITNVAAHSDASMTTAAMGYTAGASQELVPTFAAPTFAGGGSITIRVVLKLMLTEVAY